MQCEETEKRPLMAVGSSRHENYLERSTIVCAETRNEPMVPLTLVAIRALFGIKLIGRDAEDIVALSAYAVDKGLLRPSRLRRPLCLVGTWWVGSSAHSGILAWRQGKDRHPLLFTRHHKKYRL